MSKRISMTERIVCSLRLEIISGVYNEEFLITEAEISEKYGVSKTPAREALNQLCSEGLLEKMPQKGYLLKRYSAADVENLLQFRYILELNGVTMAIRTASDEDIADLRNMCEEFSALCDDDAMRLYIEHNRMFHIKLISLAGNPFMTAALANTLDQLRLAMSIDLVNYPSVIRLKNHMDMVKAFEARDAERARLLVGDFIENMNSRIPMMLTSAAGKISQADA